MSLIHSLCMLGILKLFFPSSVFTDENICCRVFLAVEDEFQASHKAVEELLWISMGSSSTR